MKAITLIDEICREFVEHQGIEPVVILLPCRIYERYDEERQRLDAILGDGCVASKTPEPGWSEIRIVEHCGIEVPEAY